MANSGNDQQWTSLQDWELWRQRHLNRCSIEDLATRFGCSHSVVVSRLENLTNGDHPLCKNMNDDLSLAARLAHLVSVYKDDSHMLSRIDLLLGRSEEKEGIGEIVQ